MEKLRKLATPIPLLPYFLLQIKLANQPELTGTPPPPHPFFLLRAPLGKYAEPNMSL